MDVWRESQKVPGLTDDQLFALRQAENKVRQRVLVQSMRSGIRAYVDLYYSTHSDATGIESVLVDHLKVLVRSVDDLDVMDAIWKRETELNIAYGHDKFHTRGAAPDHDAAPINTRPELCNGCLLPVKAHNVSKLLLGQ